MSKYDYGYEHDNVYCYPGTDVLKNKLNIHDRDELSVTERDITALRMLQLEKDPIHGQFDFEHLKSIHYFIFRDIYDWAGKVRTVDISKGVTFCHAEYIEIAAENLFKELKNDNSKIMGRTELIGFLAHYIGELNAIHPFREGNGRSQRTFINELASSHGYYLDFSKITNQEMIEASYHSFNTDDSKMILIIKKIIKEI